jgi:histidinol-phosphate/aromatic aminotransferase/cobyric acid decarboxylase-like protein
MHSWLADRTTRFDASGIRRVFELARKLKDPINLSIGQPDFDVPEVVKSAGIEAVKSGKNGYAPSSGLVELREKLQARVDAEYGHADRQVFVTSGTSGGLTLAIMGLVNPRDEVIVFDPWAVRVHRHLSGFSHRPGQSSRRDHVAHQGDFSQQPGEPDGRGGERGRGPGNCSNRGRKEHRAGQRRDLSLVLLRAVLVAG